jgi:GMP synthase (glutamine-hydrolysing)
MSEAPRLKSGLWVKAAIRSCGVHAISAMVARKGDADAGAILIKQNLLGGGFIVLTQVRRGDGQAVWLRGTGTDPVEETVADSYISRQVNRDSDLWVIEVEDRDGRLPFDVMIEK